MSRRIQPDDSDPQNVSHINYVSIGARNRQKIYLADSKEQLSIDYTAFLPTSLELSNRNRGVVLARTPIVRRQHTLDTICDRESRSRSPIVARMNPTSSTQTHTSFEDLINGRSGRRSESVPVAKPGRISPPQPMARYERYSDPCKKETPLTERSIYRLGRVDSDVVNENGIRISLSSENFLINGPDGFGEPRSKTPMIKRVATSDNEDRKYLVGSAKQDSATSRLSASSSLPSISAASSNYGTNGFAGSLDNCNTNRQVESSKNSDDIADKRRRYETRNGFEIVWLDFTYSVVPNLLEDPRWGNINKLFHTEPRTILKGLSGGLKSGQMVALMGPSGAGKTCLLESIAGLRTTGIGGRVCLRGRRNAQIVIVPQYDDFLPQFTVEETIIYGSRMKNPKNTDHKKVADEVIRQFGLIDCRHTNIDRCSGGQRKRVAIAQELTSRPNILILDEPTSGLDSSCCYQTMRVLRQVLDNSVMTKQPMAIVSTIHQPSAKVFKMFDLVYLLGKTGLMAYSGAPEDTVSTIRDITGLECPKYSNPADFMIELVSYDYGEEPVERLIDYEKEKARRFVRHFDRISNPDHFRQRSPPASDHQLQPRIVVTPQIPEPQQSEFTLTRGQGCRGRLSKVNNRLTTSRSDSQLSMKSNYSDAKHLGNRSIACKSLANHIEYANNITISLRRATSGSHVRHPFFWHVWVHLNRSFLQSIRDPVLNSMRILIHLGFALLVVILFGQKSGRARGCPPILGLPTEITDPNNESLIDLADNVSYLFMCIMLITYVSLMSTVLTFPIDIKTVGKEYKNGWYEPLSYFIGKNVADLPFITIYPVMYCFITWFLTDQAPDLWRFLSFTGLITIDALNSQSFGLILGALFVNSVASATFLGPVMTIPWYLFTGFTKRIHRLLGPFRFTSNFLFTRYVYEGLLKTSYGYGRCNCSAFLEEYHQLRYREAARIGQLISAEKLSSLDYYDGLDQVADVYNETLFPPNNGLASSWLEKTVDAASTVFADGADLNLASLMDANVKASSIFSFGLDFEPTCPRDYEPYVIQDFRIQQRTLKDAFVITLCILGVIRVLTFFLVSWKIRTRQL